MSSTFKASKRLLFTPPPSTLAWHTLENKEEISEQQGDLHVSVTFGQRPDTQRSYATILRMGKNHPNRTVPFSIYVERNGTIHTTSTTDIATLEKMMKIARRAHAVLKKHAPA